MEGVESIGTLLRALTARWIDSDTDVQEVMLPSSSMALGRPRQFLVGALVSDCDCCGSGTRLDPVAVTFTTAAVAWPGLGDGEEGSVEVLQHSVNPSVAQQRLLFGNPLGELG